MGKWGQRLKIDRGETKQRTVLFNLAQEFYPAHPSSPRKNSLSQHFFTVLLHSSWTNVHFMGKWRQGLKIDLRARKQRPVLFNLVQEFYPARPSSSRKNSLILHFFTILLHSRWTNVHFMGKWRQGLKIDLGATRQRTALFNRVQEFYPTRPSSLRKISLSLHYFTILLHCWWTNVHFMGKWRQGLKIDLGATKQRTILFNLAQEFYPAHPSSSRTNSRSLHFFTILLHSRWTNVHFMGKWGEGLKIDRGATKQRTVLFNLAQEFYPAHPSSPRKNSLSQHFFTVLLHSSWTNVHFMGKWRQGLKIDLRARKQRPVLFNLVQEFYPARPSSSRKNSLILHFFTILLHSRWTNVHFMGKWRQGLKIDLGATRQRTALFNRVQEFYPTRPSSLRKISLSLHYFTILLHCWWTNVHFMGKWRQGLKIDLGATKQRTALFNLVQEFYPARPSSSRKKSLSQHFFTILLHSRWTNVHFTDKWTQVLEIDLMAIKQRIVLFNLA